MIFENPDSTPKGQLPPPFSVTGIHEENEAFASGVWVSQNQGVSWICFYKLTPPDPVLPRMTLGSVRGTRPGESLPAQDRDKLSLLPFSLLILLPLQICSLIPYFPLHRLHIPFPPIRTPSFSSLGAISLSREESRVVYPAWNVSSSTVWFKGWQTTLFYTVLRIYFTNEFLLSI